MANLASPPPPQPVVLPEQAALVGPTQIPLGELAELAAMVGTRQSWAPPMPMVELAVQVELVAVAPSMALPVSLDLLERLPLLGLELPLLAMQDKVAWQVHVA